MDGGEIEAVASRSVDRAKAFADRFAVPSGYDDVQTLVSDSRVDAVHVATPHSRHEADTLMEAGKVFGSPDRVTADGVIGTTGDDEHRSVGIDTADVRAGDR